jgi:hypothetical protein
MSAKCTEVSSPQNFQIRRDCEQRLPMSNCHPPTSSTELARSASKSVDEGVAMTAVCELSPLVDLNNWVCRHEGKKCPSANDPDRDSARRLASHPEQGWSLLCNGTILYADYGDTEPTGRCHQPPVKELDDVARHLVRAHLPRQTV